MNDRFLRRNAGFHSNVVGSVLKRLGAYLKTKQVFGRETHLNGEMGHKKGTPPFRIVTKKLIL